ncbi:MAG: restriction endonuclease subunit S, partial [Ruminococcus flavefaciens]|nr:restriction endonuclease subunit S [Ruminococcus flavefaciens]
MDYLRLDEICDLNMGQSPSSDSYNQKSVGIPFFQGNADFGEMYPITRVWCDKPTKVVDRGTLLISVRAPIGALNFAIEKSCIGRGLAGLTVKNGYDLKYVYYALKYKEQELNNKGTGSTFKAISKSLLGEVLIPNVSIEKQKDYVKKLDLIQRMIINQKEQIEQYNLLIKSRFVEMFGDPMEAYSKW